MGIVLHSNATTTPRIREEIRNSQESIAQLAERYSLNPKTVHKWKRREIVADKKCGPKTIKSSLSELEQQIICEFRRQTKHSLDDCYISLKDQIPALTRSNLHRCLKRKNLNILPKEPEEKREKKKFKDYQIGFIHIDITEVRVEKEKLYLFVAIDRCTKYVYAEICPNMSKAESTNFLNNLIKDCPFKISKILTDNGSQFTYKLLPKHLKLADKTHPFDKICTENNIEHRLTQFRHPWTNGQVEITNKMLKNHTTKKFHYENQEQLKEHLMTFLLYYNFQKKLKSLKFIAPYDMIIKCYNSNPELFNINPCHKIMGQNN